MTDRVGQQLGNYRLLRLLGRGGFADVYLGKDVRRQMLVAVKVFHERLTDHNLKQFLNEARLFRLKHPHIVQLLDFGIEDDNPYLVMDYVPGGSLRRLHPKGTRLPLSLIVSYVTQVASALQYAHEEGIVHRDIKPENMLVGEQQQILLADFGIASIAYTTPSLVVQDQAGTIPYMAPEQLQGRPRPASDQYALGIVVYEWICGDRPFHGTFPEIQSQHLSVPPPSLLERVPSLSPLVEEIVMTALAKKPNRRFVSIHAFAIALEQACLAHADPAPKVGESPPPRAVLMKNSSPQNPPEHLALFAPSRRPLAEMAPSPLLLQGDGGDTHIAGQPPAAEDQSAPIPRPTRRKHVFLAGAALVLAALVVADILFAALNPLRSLLPGSTVTSTVTINVESKGLADTFNITAVTGTSHPAERQVAARILSATSVPGQSTVTSSGSIPGGTRATGALTFINNSNSPLTFASTVLTGKSGVPVSFNGPITVPSVPPSALTVTGFAVNVGPGGDIPAFDIVTTCCVTGILVKNTTAFTGGQNGVAHTAVEQGDIDAATNQVVAMLKPGVLSALQKQVLPNEAVAPNSLQCPDNLTANQKAGDHAGSMTVSGTITCTEEVYDQQAAFTMAMNLLKAEARLKFGPNFALRGNIVKGVTQVTPGSGGTVNLVVSAEGVWVHQFSDAAKQNLAKDIAHMSKQDATNYLLTQPGVSNVAIVISSDTILPDAAHITIEIKPVPVASGTPTTILGRPIVVPTPHREWG